MYEMGNNSMKQILTLLCVSNTCKAKYKYLPMLS